VKATTTRDPFRELVLAPAAELERRLRAGRAPAIESLVGFEWRGFNTGWAPRLLGIQKFIKGFFQAEGRAQGYNITVAQNGPAAPWLHLPAPENPKRYAFYHVTPVDAALIDNLYPAALLLDYGASARNADAPALARRLRDYLVQPDPANADLLLGKAYVALGALRFASNFFILERLRSTAWQPGD
jgi:hypothetical protein